MFFQVLFHIHHNIKRYSIWGFFSLNLKCEHSDSCQRIRQNVCHVTRYILLDIPSLPQCVVKLLHLGSRWRTRTPSCPTQQVWPPSPAGSVHWSHHPTRLPAATTGPGLKLWSKSNFSQSVEKHEDQLQKDWLSKYYVNISIYELANSKVLLKLQLRSENRLLEKMNLKILFHKTNIQSEILTVSRCFCF